MRAYAFLTRLFQGCVWKRSMHRDTLRRVLIPSRRCCVGPCCVRTPEALVRGWRQETPRRRYSCVLIPLRIFIHSVSLQGLCRHIKQGSFSFSARPLLSLLGQ